MVNLVEHFLFKEYSIATKKFLSDNLWLSRYPKEQNVAVFYSTPERAFSKLIAPVINGNNLYPTVTVNLQALELAPNQMPTGYYEKYIPSTKGNDVFDKIRHPLVYMLTYRTTIWTAKQSDLDVLLYQASAAAPPNHKYSTMVDGQWAEIEVRPPQYESELEPGDVREVLFRAGFDIIIPRAYLPFNYEEHKGKVSNVDMLYDV